MASQEHLAMLHDADDDDDDSSTSTSSSDDDDDSDDQSENDDPDNAGGADDDSSAGSRELVRPAAVTPVTGKSIAAMQASLPAATEGNTELDEAASHSIPAKKKTKLGSDLATVKAEEKDAMDMDVGMDGPSLAVTNTDMDAESSSTPSDLPMVEEQLSPDPSSKSEPTPVSSLPIKKKMKLPPHKAIMERVSTGGTENTEDAVVKATVVESDDGGEDDAVAAVVESPVPDKAKSLSSQPKIESSSAAEATSSSKQQRRQNTQGVKPVRLPPMSSPGLLIPPGQFREVADPMTGLATPSAIFDKAMSLAGYTTESRSKRPHRGSSVKRVVDDMFDPLVNFSLHFPRLVPEDLFPLQNEGVASGGQELADRLMNAFRRSRPPQQDAPRLQNESNSILNCNMGDGANGSEKRHKRKLPGFQDMVPLSLTAQYPDEYMQKRVEYIDKVNTREKAIVDYQEEELRLDKEKERKEMSGQLVPENFAKPLIAIPPIPEPPSPPRLHEIEGYDPDAFDDQHPLYLPKARQLSTVGHLDKQCFHVIDGRYFGLLTNSVADPNFVGPNAPGLGGLSLTGGTGLATANSGGGGSSGGTLLTAPNQSGASVNASSGIKSNESKEKEKEMLEGKGGSKVRNEKEANKVKPKSSTGQTQTNGGKHGKASASSKGSNAPKKKNTKGPVATASSSDLRKIMEEGSAVEAEKMRKCIVRAAVYASRCGKHTRNFRAPDGNIYPDISKAFASHADLKPCERCKNNKQGAYHCRLRRKHKELDYDGGDSPGKLAPLFKVPMEELVIRITKKKAMAASKQLPAPASGKEMPAAKRSPTPVTATQEKSKAEDPTEAPDSAEKAAKSTEEEPDQASACADVKIGDASPSMAMAGSRTLRTDNLQAETSADMAENLPAVDETPMVAHRPAADDAPMADKKSGEDSNSAPMPKPTLDTPQ